MPSPFPLFSPFCVIDDVTDRIAGGELKASSFGVYFFFFFFSFFFLQAGRYPWEWGRRDLVLDGEAIATLGGTNVGLSLRPFFPSSLPLFLFFFFFELAENAVAMITGALDHAGNDGLTVFLCVLTPLPFVFFYNRIREGGRLEEDGVISSQRVSGYAFFFFSFFEYG